MPRYVVVMTQYQNFNFDTISIRYFTKYRNINIDINILTNSKYVNFIQAQEKDINIDQGSMLYLDNKNMSLGELIIRI